MRLTAVTIDAAPTSASRRTAMGVGPAWLSRPVRVIGSVAATSAPPPIAMTPASSPTDGGSSSSGYDTASQGAWGAGDMQAYDRIQSGTATGDDCYRYGC